ncbi:MAG TPA: 3'(2'),5'-bisphosphate nucleotidase CysQ [Bacteroidales bacterium]|nr:3'(2'),5'-bisphosphate nucleotidase CysQ [Bacteroidales bacterium]HQI70194.1 3'(2'),5'-bisphosphate nucleotidase CysQ [Bacteroidales bacterium]
MAQDITELLNISAKAAVDAGIRIMEIYNNKVRIRIKMNLTPVTNADIAANQLILERLAPLKIPVISEESTKIPYQERQKWNVFWLVDPLDGTKEFLSRSNDFTVNIALVKEGVPVLGVIYAPAHDVLYFGTIRQGAFKVDAASKVVNNGSEDALDAIIPLCTPLPDTQTEIYTYVVSKSHINAKTSKYLEAKQNPKHFVSMGSSLKLCALAEGRADEYARFGRTMEWDIAAGDAILRSAGGKIRNVENSEPLKYNKENLANPEFIAYRANRQTSL